VDAETTMMPIVVLPPDSVSEADIEVLRKNGLCVVVAKEPSLVKFMDPIPAVVGRTAVEDAAIQLSRKILTKGFWNDTGGTRKEIATAYYDILIKGTALDPNPSKKEREEEIFSLAKADELRRLAREEAKAERAAAKAAKKKESTVTSK
jgi:hypothetical protein